jgi:hypothetical protein
MSLKERCKHYEVELEEQSELSMSELLPICEKKIPNEAKHGDIIFVKKFLKSLDVFFLDCTEDLNGFIVEKRLTQTDSFENGCCSVPLDVTRKIKDPIHFYSKAFKFSDYTDDDFLGIEIDPYVHDNLIRRYTGGKSLNDKTLKCFYFHTPNEWGDIGMYVWWEAEISRFIKLSNTMDEKYFE